MKCNECMCHECIRKYAIEDSVDTDYICTKERCIFCDGNQNITECDEFMGDN